MVSGNMSAEDDSAIAMLQTGMLATASPATPAKSIKKYTILTPLQFQ